MKKPFSVKAVVSILQQLKQEQEFVALHEPCFQGNEWEYVKECLDTGWVSSVGKYVDRFEQMLQEFTGVKRAVAVVNGTAALHISLKLVGVERGDEVLLPTLTFIATANAIAYCGAIPHFVDSSLETLGLDPRKLEAYLGDITEERNGQCYNKLTGRRIKAVVPMHTFGHSVDLDPLVDVCERYGLELVEDAAESLGTYYKGRHTGNAGRLSTLSFNGNKVITTGGGGAILTNDEELGKMAKHLTTTARVAHRWAFEHDQVGYNYRLPNINAALGCAQLEQLPRFLKEKRSLALKYQQEFSSIDGLHFYTEPEFSTSNYWLNTILLDSNHVEYRDVILEETNNQGIMTRPSWRLLHQLPMFSGAPKMDVSVAEQLQSSLINIPSSSKLGARNVKA
ncbi:LegC family aminotransferase [Brevibacillus borstelensis]|uniref:LegC family aminotransferase n=1 Tax=Brevibacillus borstelensis TaxID=45462 RepID=UPI00203E6228|nr:LegC family aminotransferase [Brevibacillus borstelensis]MCM3590172.1 LegC family aminotransferase [Brevibacillus borstelensis]